MKYRNDMPKAHVLGAVLAFALAAAYAPAATWSGLGADTLASNTNNWEGGSAPSTNAAIVLDATGAAYPMTWDLDFPVGSWTQDGYTNKVTFATVYNTNGFDCLVITGECMLISGTWSHKANSGTTATYRLNVSVGGDMTIGTKAAINAVGLGYTQLYTAFGVTSVARGEGGSHGGRGMPVDAATMRSIDPYGCYCAPEDPGNGGKGGGTLPGGGAVKLTIAGEFTFNGLIDANSVPGANYNGSGGSVYILASSISGAGRITADSAYSGISGSGGRIAVKLTGAGSDFSSYDILNLAQAISQKTASGASGTVYAETTADTPRHGWLIAKGNGTFPTSVARYTTPFTHEYTNLWFRRITITNKTHLTVEAGQKLDISATTLDVTTATAKDNGIYVADGGTLVLNKTEHLVNRPLKFAGAATLDCDNLRIVPGGDLWAYTGAVTCRGALSVENGGIVTVDAGLTVTGSVAVLNGGTMTRSGPYTIPATRSLNLTVGGDLSVAAGGAITATGKGYSNGNGPSPNSGSSGGSHGGYGWIRYSGQNLIAPYGSIHSPVTHGSGGSSGSGGGVVLLTVAGNITNHGVIESNGENGLYYLGAGGSVNITAGSLAGSGTGVISADGGNPTSSTASDAAAGGGRVAVTLTSPGADFGDYEGRISAYGGRYSAATRAGGAGTVYLRTAAQGLAGGTLIIDNDSGVNSGTTTLGGDVEGVAFGSVLISGGSKTTLANGACIEVSGDWSNFETFTAGVGSSVQLVGAGACAYAGDTTFANFGVSDAGKTIVFTNDARLAASENILISGVPSGRLTLASAVAEGGWTLDSSAAASIQVFETNVSNCNSVVEVTVLNGAGDDNTNILFSSVAPGETLTWSGAEGTEWCNSTNWTPAARAPVATDHVIIPSGAAHMPVLPVSAAVASINLQSGATLTLGNRSLTVAGVSTLAGKLVFSGAGEFNALGDVNCSGGIVAAQSVFRLAGASPQNATFNGITLYEFSIENPSVKLGGDFACNRFTVGDGATACDVGFSSGMTMAPAEFNVSGDTSVTNVTLHAAPPSGTWHLNASKASVSGAKVSGSDASEGVMVVPVACADEGGNSNWLFNDTRAKWSGAADSAFDNTANWQGATVPGADDDVLVAVANPMVISSGASLHSLTLADGASVTIDSALAVAGSVTVGDGATLAWNRPGTIGGNLAVHAGGTLTHSGNTTTEANKLDLAVGGNGLIESGAEVDVKGKGYMTGKGPGWGVTTGGAGASHGGRGYKSKPIGVNKACYGSILCPTNCGAGGQDNTYPGYGGGVAVLKFAGALVLDGEIDADGTGVSFYTASGGSVWISAASLTGGGAAHAHGGDGSNDNLGGGGRLAVYVTAARDLGVFTGTFGTYGGAISGKNAKGSAGTVYIETAADQAGRGRLLVANKPKYVNQKPDEDMTDLPSGSLCAANEGRDIYVDVGYYGTLNLTADFRISDLRLLDSTSRVKLNGYTLSIRARRHALGVNEAIQVIPGGTVENPGKIVWLPSATLIYLR